MNISLGWVSLNMWLALTLANPPYILISNMSFQITIAIISYIFTQITQDYWGEYEHMSYSVYKKSSLYDMCSQMITIVYKKLQCVKI